jgi:hypothetical protein
MLDAPGAELPLHEDGRLTAHISVMSADEVTRVGGPQALLHDRGRRFNFSLGRLVEISDPGQPGMSKVWVIRVFSTELAKLRRSYGLSGLPNNGKYAFHITVGRRRRGVLAEGSTVKMT